MSDTCNIEFGEIDLSHQNPTLSEIVDSEDSELKSWLVEYVGKIKKPENDEVTVDLVVEVLSEEFPECILVLAEENYIRGYEQALNDVDSGKELYEEQLAKQQDEQSN